MPRHNPLAVVDDFGALHGRRIERDNRARGRRRARRRYTESDGAGRGVATAREEVSLREIERETQEWRAELALPA